jgi:CBS domain containing-hemolysin-like protein
MGDGHIWFELFIIVLLVLGNAVCSLAEIAIVGARKTKLQELADEGKRGAAQALKLTGRKMPVWQKAHSTTILYARKMSSVNFPPES